MKLVLPLEEKREKVRKREEEGGAAHFVLFSKVALPRDREGEEPNAETHSAAAALIRRELYE